MTRILILAYIVAVVLISGFARAASAHKQNSQDGIVIEAISFSDVLMALSISGKSFNPCHQGFYPQVKTITPLAASPSLYKAEVSVLGEGAEEACVTGFIKPKSFQIQVDVRSLGLEAGHDYYLYLEGLKDPVQIQIPGDQGSWTGELPTSQIIGTVIYLNLNDSYALLTEEGDVFELKSEKSLSAFESQKVQVSVPNFDLQIYPVLENSTDDGSSMGFELPLLQGNRMSNSRQKGLQVLGIYTL